MNLAIEFPSNLITSELIEQSKIPCLCKVSDRFEVHFFNTIPESEGVVEGWDRRELELRAMAGAGGKYTHYAHSLITIKKASEGKFKIVDLEMFYTSFGWCPVVINGEYAPPGKFWDEE